MDIVFEDLIQEIQRLDNANPEGFTIAELSSYIKMSRYYCREAIKELIIIGKVKYNGKAKLTDMCGRPCYVPVYILVNKKKK